MAGFGAFDTPKKKKVSSEPEFDENVSARLKNALASARLLPAKRTTLAGWSNEIKLLREYVEKEEILQVLKWYIEHIKDEYVPRIYSAKKFRTEFVRIKEAMERSGSSVFIDINFPITPEAHRIKQRANLNWPRKRERVAELPFIQVSINNYREFHFSLLTMADTLDRAKSDYVNAQRILRFVKYLIETNPAISELIAWWTKEVHNIATTWPGWNGDLMAWVFTWKQEKFQKLMYSKAMDYCNDGSRWETVAEYIEKHLSKSR